MNTMTTATMWTMATAMRVAGDEDGESDGSNSDGHGDEGERWQQGRWQRQQWWCVSNAYEGRRQKVMARAARAITTAKRAMAWKRAMVRAARAMATMTRVAGDKEGEGIEEGDEDKEGVGNSI